MTFSELRECRLFSGRNDAQLTFALQFFGATEKEYAKGECVTGIGEPFRRFGLVLSGNVLVFSDNCFGEQTLMQSVTAGQTFGEALCFLEKETEVYAMAVEKCRIVWLKTDRVKTAATPEERELANRFTAMLAVRTLQKNNHVQILSKRTLRAKLIALFSQYAGVQGETFSLPFDRAALASFLAVNRTALSRELSAMQKEGWITFRKNQFTIHKKFFEFVANATQ